MGPQLFNKAAQKAAVILALHSSFHTYTNTSIDVSIPQNEQFFKNIAWELFESVSQRIWKKAYIPVN